ncbi:MAG: PBS lyase HEAT-like repeat protein [Promethearchaeota archaeon]|nr:MAG: PBS lyase HEAT-like repeat protein [Candidatus Lokiarchaeota archaeon]
MNDTSTDASRSKDADMNSLLNKLFHAERWQERAAAARELGFLKDGRAVNLMCTALKKEQDHMVINRIIEALGRIGNVKATSLIIERLQEAMEKNTLDKYRLIIIIESLINIKDKRALAYIGHFLNSEDEEVRDLAREAFDIIEPNWREIIERESKERTIEDIFKTKL